MKHQVRNVGNMWQVIEIGTGKIVGFATTYSLAKCKMLSMDLQYDAV